MPEPTRKVMISSTARDLPEHRKEVQEACLRQGMFPIMMEHLPASDAEAIEASRRMVDEAEIYLGIFAHRYGYVPKGHNISITEMEYDRAVERKIPRLIFLMHDDHPIKVADVEKDSGAAKLAALKERVGAERVAGFFTSPAELRALVIDSLSHYREPDLTAFHYVRDIPTPPAPYIAHPYTLLQTRELVGRQVELNLLTDWVTHPDASMSHPGVLNIVAIGGTGKSALTWKWFNDIAPLEMQPLAGRLWWSFYESDASFENFVIRALAYVTRRGRKDIYRNTKPGEREGMLLQILDREPFLLVLDGLERILIAYARIDAARLTDDDLDQQTANIVAGALGLPESAATSFIFQHRLRKTADPRAGNFLRKLASVQASRILISTRLYPAELQNPVTGIPISGCFAHVLNGLSNDDAIELWRTFGVSGTPDELLPLFGTFDNHPLLLQALASEVACYRRAPGNFDAWRRANPTFDPFRLPLVQVRSHVLAFALLGLDEKARKTLHTIAAFRTPAGYDTLVSLLVGKNKAGVRSKLFANEQELDITLVELEDRGLLGWDRRANRYDLHPVVRGVVWSGLGEWSKREIYMALELHFETLPAIDFHNITSFDDLASAIEQYNTLIGLELYEDALWIYTLRMQDPMLYKLIASQQQSELLEMLFPDGTDRLPKLSDENDQAYALICLAHSYLSTGRPGGAAKSYYEHINICMKRMDHHNLITGLRSLALALFYSGKLYDAEAIIREALLIVNENKPQDARRLNDLGILGMILSSRGLTFDSETILLQAQRICIKYKYREEERFILSLRAQQALWQGTLVAFQELADRAWKLRHRQQNKRYFIRVVRLQGLVALRHRDLALADERLHYTLAHARAVNLVEEELPTLTALAELRRYQSDHKAARDLLDDGWEAAERGPYPLFHADAYNVLARIERDAGNTQAAIDAATAAYRLAWCDGPPFAYHWGLEAARVHLAALGAPEPELPPFDESKYEPMPEVEIDPPETE